MNRLCEDIVKLLIQNNITLSCAESCTGGLIAKSITDISGCSQAFYGGVIAYDNSVKINVLGVDKDTLNSLGAVSYEVAKEMALGVKKICNTDIGISTTGIAGPLGGTKEKPVGTVYIGFANKDGADARLLKLCPSLSRDEIRKATVNEILLLVKEKIG